MTDDVDTDDFELDLSVPATAVPRPVRRRERPFPAEVRISTKGLKPNGRGGTVHGYHSADAVEIPTTLTCNLCALYHVKRKNRRHHLACPEGRRDQVCPILTRKQMAWASELIGEVTQTTGRDPSASQLATVEQIVRYRSRLFQIENYLKVAGLIDLREGEVRAVADRLGGVESGITAIRDPNILGDVLSPAQEAALRTLYGLPVDTDGAALVARCTGRVPEMKEYREAAYICGHRSGKSDKLAANIAHGARDARARRQERYRIESLLERAVNPSRSRTASKSTWG